MKHFLQVRWKARRRIWAQRGGISLGRIVEIAQHQQAQRTARRRELERLELERERRLLCGGRLLGGVEVHVGGALDERLDGLRGVRATELPGARPAARGVCGFSFPPSVTERMGGGGSAF